MPEPGFKEQRRFRFKIRIHRSMIIEMLMAEIRKNRAVKPDPRHTLLFQRV